MEKPTVAPTMGPWGLALHKDGTYHVLAMIDESGGTCVALATLNGPLRQDGGMAETHANAALMASAPMMRDALRYIAEGGDGISPAALAEKVLANLGAD